MKTRMLVLAVMVGLLVGVMASAQVPTYGFGGEIGVQWDSPLLYSTELNIGLRALGEIDLTGGIVLAKIQDRRAFGLYFKAGQCDLFDFIEATHLVSADPCLWYSELKVKYPLRVNRSYGFLYLGLQGFMLSEGGGDNIPSFGLLVGGKQLLPTPCFIMEIWVEIQFPWTCIGTQINVGLNLRSP